MSKKKSGLSKEQFVPLLRAMIELQSEGKTNAVDKLAKLAETPEKEEESIKSSKKKKVKSPPSVGASPFVGRKDLSIYFTKARHPKDVIQREQFKPNPTIPSYTTPKTAKVGKPAPVVKPATVEAAPEPTAPETTATPAPAAHQSAPAPKVSQSPLLRNKPKPLPQAQKNPEVVAQEYLDQYGNHEEAMRNVRQLLLNPRGEDQRFWQQVLSAIAAKHPQGAIEPAKANRQAQQVQPATESGVPNEGRPGRRSPPTEGVAPPETPRTAHQEAPTTPPVLPWQPPPPPKGPEQTITGVRTNAKDLAGKMNLRPIPSKDGTKPFDRTYGDNSQYVFDVKVFFTTATAYKPNLSEREVNEKMSYAEDKQLKPATMVCVIDEDKIEAHFYWHDGLVNKELPISKNHEDWNFAGTISFGRAREKALRIVSISPLLRKYK